MTACRYAHGLASRRGRHDGVDTAREGQGCGALGRVPLGPGGAVPCWQGKVVGSVQRFQLLVWAVSWHGGQSHHSVEQNHDADAVGSEAMSLTGRKWTERQRFDFAEAKLAKWHAQRGLCATCTHYHQGVETMEWAHRIPDTKVNRRVYGKAVLSHPANGALVCKEMRAGRDL